MDKEGKLDQLKGEMLGNVVRIDLTKLCLPTDDVEWCMTRGISPLDYAKYRAHWEEEYTQVVFCKGSFRAVNVYFVPKVSDFRFPCI
jgi:hypothetical protein